MEHFVVSAENTDHNSSKMLLGKQAITDTLENAIATII